MNIDNAAESRRLLKRFLSQYFRAKEKRAILEDRLKQLQRELKTDPEMTPPSFSAGLFSENKNSTGDTSLAFQTGDIESRIRSQIEAQKKSVSEIMDILDFLPAESTERDILEHRHIDCKTWSEICSLVHMTKSPCFEHYNRALDKLLTYAKVRATLEAYEDRLAREARDSY